MKRCGFYVDGLNVYHSIDALKQPHLKWVSYQRLANALLGQGEDVAFVKLFTTVAEHLPESAERHRRLLRAWQAEGTICILGHFKQKMLRCRHCRREDKRHEEKETDVCFAVELLADAYEGRLDVAYLITTDSDLAPAAKMLFERRPEVELVAVRTPGRKHSKELLHWCHRKGSVKAAMLEVCRLDDVITDHRGRRVFCPREYKRP